MLNELINKYMMVVLYFIIIFSILFCIFCYLMACKKKRKLQHLVVPDKESLHVNPMRIKQEKVLRII